MTQEIDVMSALFKGQIDLEQPNMIKAELGYGKGLAERYGDYKQYTQKVAALSGQENPVAYLGKDVMEDNANNTISITGSGNEFQEGESIVVLLEYKNLIHAVNIRAHWLGSAIDSWSMFDIPSPISQLNTHWWNVYYVWMYAPDGLTSGEYKVELYSTELDKKMETMMDEFLFQVM